MRNVSGCRRRRAEMLAQFVPVTVIDARVTRVVAPALDCWTCAEVRAEAGHEVAACLPEERLLRRKGRMTRRMPPDVPGRGRR